MSVSALYHSLLFFAGAVTQALACDDPVARTVNTLSQGEVQPPSMQTTAQPLLFEAIVSVRELADRRLLLTDGGTRLLYTLDSSLTRRAQIGRKGDGPNEYRSPGMIIALSGNHSVVIDRQNRKFYMLSGDRFVESPAPFRPPSASWRGTLFGISDDYSRFTTVAHGPRVRLPFPTFDRTSPVVADSVVFIRSRASGRADTIAFGKSYHSGAISKRVRIGNTNDLNNTIHPLQTFDQGWMFPDGTVAIVRVNPYRVDWYDAGGVAVGPSVNEPSTPITRTIKQWIMNHTLLDVNGAPKFRPEDFAQWPRTLPPFTSFSVRGGSDGRVYVERTVISERQRIDVFDRARGRVNSVELPPHSRMVGTGARDWYLAQRTDDDEEALIRWTPPSR